MIDHDLIIRYITALGFPIAVSIALAYGMVVIFKMYVAAVEDRQKRHDEYAVKLATLTENTSEALNQNTAAMNARTGALENNTEATQELSQMIRTVSLCKFKPQP